MNDVIETIRAAMQPDASDEARASGAVACRAILATLETTAGQPLTEAVQPATPINAAVGALSAMSSDQLLDVAIARLRALLPAGTTVEPVQPLNFPLLPIAPTRGAP